jgi:hypothetical protein
MAPSAKIRRIEPDTVPISSCERLEKALRGV